MNKTLKKIKALSPVISVLLLVIIAAVASVMLYIWFSGYFSTQASKATSLSAISVSIKQVTALDGRGQKDDTLTVIVAVQNLADEHIKIESNDIRVYVNGTDITSSSAWGTTAKVDPSPITLAPGESATIVFTVKGYNNNFDFKAGHRIDVSVVVEATGTASGATYSDSASTSVIIR